MEGTQRTDTYHSLELGALWLLKVCLLGAESSPEEENGQISSTRVRRSLSHIAEAWLLSAADGEHLEQFATREQCHPSDFSFREVAFKKFWREQARDQETALGF